MTKGVGIGTEMLGEATGELMKPGMTRAQLEELEKTPLSGPDPFGDVFREDKKVAGLTKATAPPPMQQRAPLPEQGSVFTEKTGKESGPPPRSFSSQSQAFGGGGMQSASPMPPQAGFPSQAPMNTFRPPSPAPCMGGMGGMPGMGGMQGMGGMCGMPGMHGMQGMQGMGGMPGMQHPGMQQSMQQPGMGIGMPGMTPGMQAPGMHGMQAPGMPAPGMPPAGMQGPGSMHMKNMMGGMPGGQFGMQQLPPRPF
jgi:hypothetical protein